MVWAGTFGCSDHGANTLSEELDGRGADMDRLFAEPRAEELEAIRSDWALRDLTPRDVREEARSLRPSGDTVRVLSHRLDGGIRYGAVVIPAGAQASMPVVVLSIGFGPPYELDLNPARAAYDGSAITVLPGFRGHRLLLEGQEWRSEGPLFDHCDGGTDDMLAFVRVALAHEPRADSSRVFAFGGSRGGNVSLLGALRDPIIRRVVSLAGPTNYLLRDYLDHPNLGPLYLEWFVAELLDDPSEIAMARQEMLSCSPRYFLANLPTIQLHHGDADLSVPVNNTRSFAELWHRERGDEDLEVFYYPGEGHDFGNNNELVNERGERFLTSAF